MRSMSNLLVSEYYIIQTWETLMFLFVRYTQVMRHAIHKMVVLQNICCGYKNVCTCIETLHYCGTRHFRSTVWRNYILNCLGKCLLKRIAVYCWNYFCLIMVIGVDTHSCMLVSRVTSHMANR